MRLLPAFLRRSLAPSMREAERVLAGMSSRPRAEFASKVRFLPVGPPLCGPQVDQPILDAAAEALYRGRKLAAMYAPRGQKARPYTLHPLGLVVKGPVLILVAWAEERRSMRTMALHRFASLSMLDGLAEAPPGFDLDEYIEQGELGMKLSGAPIELEVRFHPDLTPDFAETRLAEDQILTTDPDGWGRVRALVFDTFELRGWLLRFADRVAVAGPAPLRAEFARMTRGMAAHYADCVSAPADAGSGA
jgi:predicted DNA-binding transcriptional regulator YafY